MPFDANQLLVSVLAILLASAVAGVFVLYRSPSRRALRRRCSWLLWACAAVSLLSWFRFGQLQTNYIDAPEATPGSVGRRKIEVHMPLHFHEFFHYYLGAKYFRELGYEGLYDCTALADAEIAAEQGVPPRISGYVRDLHDVLTDKTYDEAKRHCREELRPGISAARWASFENDLRELQRLVRDDWWNIVVHDAGFNPPPSWVVVDSAIANVIPIRLGTSPTFLFATMLDMVLVLACFRALRRFFGAAAAAMAVIYFGASFISTYGWTGGAFLRYTWVASIVFALAATVRGHWMLAGALFAAATCDRLFPLGFAIGAVLPLAVRAMRSPDDRRRLLRFATGFSGVVAVLVVLSTVLFGVESWHVFFWRILRHGDVYFVMNIGLKKVLTWRDWVASQRFHGHDGMQSFHDWNLHLRSTWANMRPVAIPMQIAAVAGAAYAGSQRRPHESAILFGVVVMFFLGMPGNYYYVVLALVPALLLRAAATAPTPRRRLREYAALTAFSAFWMTTLISSRLSSDDIVYDHLICVALLVFLTAWIALWVEPPGRVLRRLRRRLQPSP
jgi:hypothetical protein